MNSQTLAFSIGQLQVYMPMAGFNTPYKPILLMTTRSVTPYHLPCIVLKGSRLEQRVDTFQYLGIHLIKYYILFLIVPNS